MKDKFVVPEDYKLDPEVKRHIVETLRSKKYKFTEGTLFENVWNEGKLEGQYCTLGVVYKELAQLDDHDLEGYGSLTSDNIPLDKLECIPKAFLADDEVGEIITEKIFSINDKSKSYRRAATWIEKNL